MFTAYIKKLSPFIILLSGIAFFFFAEFLYNNKHFEHNYEKRVETFRESFLKNYDYAVNSLEKFINEYKEFEGYNDLGFVNHYGDKYKKHGFVFVAGENNNATFWSNNKLAFYEIESIEDDRGLIELQNGYYYYIKTPGEYQDFFVFMLLKHNYNYQNKHLKNTYFQKYHQIPDHFQPTQNEGEYKVLDRNEEDVLFYFSAGEQAQEYYKSGFLHYSSVVFSIIAIFLIFYGIYSLVFKILCKNCNYITGLSVFVFLVVLVRVILYDYGIASPLKETELFSPSLYATSYYLPSLGDLFFNVILVLWITWIVNKKLTEQKFASVASFWKKAVIGLFGTALIGMAGYVAFNLIRGLVINSRLNLNVNFVLSLDYYSIIGFLIIGCILFAFYFFISAISRYFKETIKPKPHMYFYVFVSYLVLGAIIYLGNLDFPLFLAIFIILVSVVVLGEKSPEGKFQNFSNLILYIFIFSSISTVALYEFNNIKEKSERKSIALNLSSEQDPIAEYLFLEIENDLIGDQKLNDLIYYDPYNEKAVYDYLSDNYFYDYWLKYDIQVTICQPEELLLIKPENVEIECSYFFENYIDSYGKEVESDYMFYLDNNTGRDSYIVRVPVFFDNELLSTYPEETPDYYVNVELDSKHIPRELGFPELLVDESVDIGREFLNYSFAFYKFGELTRRVGDYFFNKKSAAYGDFQEEFVFFEIEEYSHLNYQKDEDTQIIVSREKFGFFEIIAPFSYLFILFFLIGIVFWLISGILKGNLKPGLNFKSRVQLSMVIIVILSVISIGWASVWFLFDIHEEKSLDNIREKAHSVMVELEHELGEEPYLDYHYSYFLSDHLLMLSHVFFADINLFSPEGNLLASSRSRIYDEGLVSEYMDPVARNQMTYQNKSFFVQKEQIGSLEYLSAYLPLNNNNNETLAYINLPYFARESELRYEASTFLVTFININLLLLVLAIVIAFSISNYVTRPLQFIRENLSQVKLGKTNQKIDWYRNDEIGNLVKEYNRMIDELEISAELLAKDERESAWREMAKQVAHEIKNPLTPMKLSVQYLQKAYKDRVDDWEERLDGFTNTMIEQIDSLSLIASEFSDFAKLPSNNNSKIELNSFIPDVVKLYKDFDKVKIKLNIQEQKMIIYADSKQMLRVFNNIIKNAIQSYNKDETAFIFIECVKEGSQAVIKVKDEGCGIPPEQQDKIFNPYFTTKTGGLGLGLAMVKNIVESFNGAVTFETQTNSGTTFIIRLPLISES